MHGSRAERARALVLLALALPAAAAPDAHGQEPPSYGHRIGLSQYGAAARAGAGHDATAILDFYYPGTGRASTAPATIRVLLYDRHRVVVRRAPGLRRTVFAARGGVVTRAGRSTGRRTVVVRGPFCLRSCYRGVLVLSVRPDGSLRAVNRVRTWRGAPILAMYTAANGGWTRGFYVGGERVRFRGARSW